MRDAVAELFATADDAMAIIRWKDIHERLEEAVDASRTRPTCSRRSSSRTAGRWSNVLLVVVVVVALGFDFTNGFHDTANAVATSV